MHVRQSAGARPAHSIGGERFFVCRRLGVVVSLLLASYGGRVGTARSQALLRSLAAVLLLAGPVGSVSAQHPATIAGRVIDAAGGGPIAGARITVVESVERTTTDGAGAFVLRGMEPGTHTLRIARRGYADTTLVVRAENGRTVPLVVALAPRPEPLAGIAVRGDRTADGGVHLNRTWLDRSGAGTAGDALRGVAGVVVNATGPGSAQTASIRGSDAGAVLVVVDGVVVNDPVTGEADLSTIPAAHIESLLVLPGARSAQWGPRAQAGVIVVTTRRSSRAEVVEASIGSLGGREVRAEAGSATPLDWSVGGGWRRADNVYDFDLPAQVGGGRAARANADVSAADAFATTRATVAGGELGVRLSAERLARGLPGIGFAPSPLARQTLERARSSVSWQREAGGGVTAVSLASVAQRLRFRDTEPPFGLPYDDTTRLAIVELRAETERVTGEVVWGAGVQGQWQRIETTALVDPPSDPTHGGGFAHVATGFDVGGGSAVVALAGRLDRDGVQGDWFATHSIALSYAYGGATAQLAHRSSYSPPALGDQFFREAVGVEPNPSLRPERVPSEIELGLGVETDLALGALRARIAVYRGDTRDMIVWAPDFRFVWRPSNIDVHRRGVDASLRIDREGVLRSIDASYGYARVAYAAATNDAQLAYRPRHTAQVRAALEHDAWSGAVTARYTGVRYPAAARVNALPGFWTTAVTLDRAWSFGALQLTTGVRVDRILDEKDTLIFGFPEPGRAVALRVRVTRSHTTR